MATLKPAVRPLSSFPLIDTTNAEVLRNSVERTYRKTAMEFVGRSRQIHAIMNHCQLTKIGIGYAEFNADVLWRFPPSPIAVQVFPLDGKAEIVTENGSIVVKNGHGAAISPNAGFSMKNSADYRRLLLTIDSVALESAIAALSGQSVGSPFRLNDRSNPRSTNLLELQFKFLVQQISNSCVIPPIVMAEFEQSLIIAFLHANEHNYTDWLNIDAAEITPREVRRAEEYIEAKWNRPLDLLSLASITGVSIRSLSRKFRQSRGYSPMEFLRQTRLRHARQMLQRPESTTMVANVAFICCFGSVGQFEGAYLRAFGELPSQTLARSKGNIIFLHKQ